MQKYNAKFKIIATFYIVLVFFLFLYSYTQVDLNLTLSKWSIWQIIQTSFQYIGWFNRPLSTGIYLALIILLTAFYLFFLSLIKQDKMSRKQFWVTILFMSGILLFAYNAFSYDLFNYMFDARIFTLHGENPYQHKALDYLSDPWINFMRWTHRTYPYGPVWLGLTIPLSFVGFQIFLPTLFLFKSLMVASFVGTVYYIGKVLEKINPKKKLIGMAFFAFNPLVIVESLVSAHHDIVMIFLSIASIYFILDKKYIRAFLLLFLSIGVKFASVFLIPLFLILYYWQKTQKRIDFEKVFTWGVLLMSLAVVIASMRTELQPWYLIWILPLASFLRMGSVMVVLPLIFSVGLLLYYVPFLYTGNWDPPIPTIKVWITIGSFFTGCVVYLQKFFTDAN